MAASPLRLFGRARQALRQPSKRSRWNPPRLSLERLEDRLAPATLTEADGGTTLVITLDNANDPKRCQELLVLFHLERA
jgi:hypothetical protein